MYAITVHSKSLETHSFICQSRDAVSILTYVFEKVDQILQYKVFSVDTETLYSAGDLGFGASPKWVKKFTYTQ
jgi:hypothetical protein